VEYFHSDFSLQALAKLERGHAQDLEDVTRLLRGGYTTCEELRTRLAQIEPGLLITRAWIKASEIPLTRTIRA